MSDIKKNIKFLMFSIIFFVFFDINIYADTQLKSIKVSKIGKKTRVSFIFNEKTPYVCYELEKPYRLLVDFEKHIISDFDSVKVFDIGFVKNVRSYFVEKKGKYFLDVCVIELDRKCLYEIFWIKNILHIDFKDKAKADAEEKIKLTQKLNNEKSENLYREAKQFYAYGDLNRALEKLEQSLKYNPNNKKAQKMYNDLKKYKKNKKNIYKEAKSFARELAKKMKKEKKEAKKLEKVVKKKKKIAIERLLDIKDLEEKGNKAFEKGDYEKALDFWEKALEKQPNNIEIARCISIARKKLKAQKNKTNKKEKYNKDTNKNRKKKKIFVNNFIGNLEIRKYEKSLEDNIIFLTKKEPIFYYTYLENPFRVMLYFKSDIFSNMPEKKDIDGVFAEKISVYYYPGYKNYDIKKVEAIVIRFKNKCKVEVYSMENNILIKAFKKKN